MKNRYENTSKIIRERVSGLGTTVYVVPPESVEDYYLISTVGDRFDILANQHFSPKNQKTSQCLSQYKRHQKSIIVIKE